MNISDLKSAGSFADMSGVKALVYGAPGSGKCLAPGTPIIMFDGSVKLVEHIKQGDLLMGPDSNSRLVKGLAYGFDDMFDVIPVKGMTYRVNKPHILSLKVSGKETYLLPTIEEYFAYPKSYRGRLKGWRTGVEFTSKYVHINPYLLGLWLGDGSSDELAFHTKDEEIVEFLNEIAPWYGLTVKEYKNKEKCPRYRLTHSKGANPNKLKECFRKYNLFNNKHVPLDFKANSRQTRLAVLAGILDTDGYMDKRNGFQYSSKLEILADDVCYLARSLGLAAYKRKIKKECVNNAVWGEYYTVSISGNTEVIPVRISRKKAKPRKQIKSHLVTGIKIIPVGYGEYYGFELDGDGLFLLGDFTVTHNTPVFSSAPRPILLACEPGLLSMKGSQVPTYQAYTGNAVDDFFQWFFNSKEASNFDTIGVDSVSQMADTYLQDALKGKSKSGSKMHGLAAYGVMATSVMDHLRPLFFMKEKHCYLICKQTSLKENGFDVKAPYFPGQQLPTEVPHLYDMILHLGIHNVPGRGQIQSFQTRQSIDITARDRSGKLDEFEPPDFNWIVKKAVQG